MCRIIANCNLCGEICTLNRPFRMALCNCDGGGDLLEEGEFSESHPIYGSYYGKITIAGRFTTHYRE